MGLTIEMKRVIAVLDDVILSYNQWAEIEKKYGVTIPSKMKDEIENALRANQKVRFTK
jgi:hypothetical protein